MKRRLFAPIIIASLFLAGCNFSFLNSGEINSGSGSGSSPTSGNVENEPTITSVSIKTKLKLKPGNSATLTATVTGQNNPDKAVTWSTSDSAVATVSSSGVVNVPSTATPNTTATITATSTVDTTKSANCTVTVLDPSALDSYTILMYICGSTLECEGYHLVGAASDDISEVLSVNGQPDDVNIVIETGGSEGWVNSKIPDDKLGRFHVRDKQLVADTPVTNASMGEASTLRSFLTWGMETYPADKYALILWNHGGAVSGVCMDENFSGDCLTTAEVAQALTGAFSDTGTSKLEWIGYDACLMNYIDNISVMADYASYYIGAEESELGDGWAYDLWLPTLYNDSDVSTPTLLNKICKTFVEFYDQYVTSGELDDNDQTLSAIDLSKAQAFTDAFNAYTSDLTTSDFSKLRSAYQSSSLIFGEDSFGVVDFKNFLNKFKSYVSKSTTELEQAFDDMIIANHYGNHYTGSNKPSGSSIFVCATCSSYRTQISKSDYTASDTKFSNWRTVNLSSSYWYH